MASMSRAPQSLQSRYADEHGIKPKRRWRRTAATLLGGTMLLAGGIAVVDNGPDLIDGTTPAALAQVATLGTPPPDAEASAAPAEELSAEDSMLAYAACMRENGVETDDPQFDINGDLISKPTYDKGKEGETFQAASEACGDLLLALKPALDPALQAEQTENALRFAACMRDQGLDWPDPAPDGSKFAGSEVKVDKGSPEFAAAFEACGDELAVDAAEGEGKSD